jgi:glycosyltransferase involved in cell wall biosynthesis
VKIELYGRCYDDAHMLPFFFRHYDPFVDRYIIFDDGSTDGSIELLAAHPKVDLRRLANDSHPDSRVLAAKHLAETCWRESGPDVDWVVFAEPDEHLFLPGTPAYLAACKAAGVTVLPSFGYQMLSHAFPGDRGAPLHRLVTRGAPDDAFNKLGFFSPNDVAALVFTPGLHACQAFGRVVAPERTELLLLHYKFLDFERLVARHRNYAARSLSGDIERGWGVHYDHPRELQAYMWREVEDRLVEVLDPAPDHEALHPKNRWWNGLPRRPV